MSTNDPSGPAPVRAVRLIFEYEGDEVRLVSQHPVEMVITGFDLPRAERPGHFVDTRDAAGLTLARVPVRDAFASSAEVFPEKPGEPISRVDVSKPKGVFTVVVPMQDEADHVSVVRVAPRDPNAPPLAPRATTAVPGRPEVTDLARFSLKTGSRL